MGKTIDADALWKNIIGKYDSVLGLGDLMEELVNAPAVEPNLFYAVGTGSIVTAPTIIEKEE